MISQPNRLLDILLVCGLVSCGLAACSSTPGGETATGGTTSSGGAGSGGVTASGGSSATGGTVATGGSVSSGGKSGSGGSMETGGSVSTGGSSSGGTTTTSSGGSEAGGASGGAGNGGTSGKGGSSGSVTGGQTTATGGRTTGTGGATRPGTGGTTMAGTGGTTTAGTGGSGAGGSTSGCQKGQVKANEVVIMGESFYAMDPKYIQTRIESNARTAGAIGASDKYRNVAVSGQTMNYIATTEWSNASKSTTKVVIMDGGGIDCMSSSCSSCPGDFTTLLGKMATAGVQEVIYTRYPEPGNPPGSNTTLKGNLDILMPKMETVCKGSTSPRCHWVDLRPVWVNGDTSDGLHPTQSGGNHVGDAIWAEMVKSCIAQ